MTDQLVALETSRFSAVRRLVELTPSPQYPLGVIEGPAPGWVFVDDPDEPALALVWEEKGDVSISGESGQGAISAVAQILNDVIIPSGERHRRHMFYINYYPESWGDILPSMLPSHVPMPDKRLLYSTAEALAGHLLSGTERRRIAASSFKGLFKAPEGCTLEEVGACLLTRNDLRHMPALREEILKQWNSIEEFCALGFGFCLVCGADLAAWCLIEYPTECACSIGVETVEEFQRRGFGTIVAAACLKKCLEQGKRPYWDLWASNTASKALAEKLGLSFIREYPVLFLWYNRVDNLIVNAGVAARKGALKESIEYFETALEAAKTATDLSLSMIFGTSKLRATQYRVMAKVASDWGRPDLATAYSAKARKEEQEPGVPHM